VNPATRRFFTLAMTRIRFRLSKVEDLADTALAQKVSQLPGVGLVPSAADRSLRAGSSESEQALASYGLSLKTFARRWRKPTWIRPRESSTDRAVYTIGANDQLFSSDQYKPIVIGPIATARRCG